MEKKLTTSHQSIDALVYLVTEVVSLMFHYAATPAKRICLKLIVNVSLSLVSLATAYFEFIHKALVFVLICFCQEIMIKFLFQAHGRDLMFDFYQHYKYYHFYAVCFGLGCGTALYRPFRSLILPAVLAVLFTVVFEILGIVSDLPAHTRRCKGRPYGIRDVYWGFGFALFVAILNLNSYHVYTLSYGCGIIVFALRGAHRKYSSLRNLRERQRRWW